MEVQGRDIMSFSIIFWWFAACSPNNELHRPSKVRTGWSLSSHVANPRPPHFEGVAYGNQKWRCSKRRLPLSHPDFFGIFHGHVITSTIQLLGNPDRMTESMSDATWSAKEDAQFVVRISYGYIYIYIYIYIRSRRNVRQNVGYSAHPDKVSNGMSDTVPIQIKCQTECRIQCQSR